MPANHHFYFTKDFPVHPRALGWGWVVPPHGYQAVALQHDKYRYLCALGRNRALCFQVGRLLRGVDTLTEI